MKTLARISAILLAAAFFAGLTSLCARYRPPDAHGAIRTRYASAPQPDRLPNFMGQFVLVGAIALAGRKILRLRLAR